VKVKVFEENNVDPHGANLWLNMRSIGIELDSWGGAKDPANKKFDAGYRYKDGYRGYKCFEAYTEEQINSLKELLTYLCEKYDIPTEYNDDMWDVSTKALNGEAGIWSHTSFRPDKSDCHPQESLIKMLKDL
jgi:hypothetical protein